jgi:outer membrane receptor protein involved in Fe transport
MYETGPLTAALSWQWMDSVREAYSKYSVQPGETYIPAVSKLDSQDYFDFTLDWQLSQSLKFTLSVKNLTDTQPPFLPNNEENTASTTYDVLGRRYYATVQFKL